MARQLDWHTGCDSEGDEQLVRGVAHRRKHAPYVHVDAPFHCGPYFASRARGRGDSLTVPLQRSTARQVVCCCRRHLHNQGKGVGKVQPCALPPTTLQCVDWCEPCCQQRTYVTAVLQLGAGRLSPQRRPNPPPLPAIKLPMDAAPRPPPWAAMTGAKRIAAEYLECWPERSARGVCGGRRRWVGGVCVPVVPRSA